MNGKDKWNSKYLSTPDNDSQATQVLAENIHLLPQTGTALDLACGLGGNALLLAKLGFTTHAWDISEIAINKLQAKADELGLVLNLEQRDIVEQPPPANSFDVIVVSHFLDRKIIPNIIQSLKQNGLIFYQTFTRDKISVKGPTNPDYLLKNNELLELFSKLSILYYREDGNVGDLSRGVRNEAMLVAQKI